MAVANSSRGLIAILDSTTLELLRTIPGSVDRFAFSPKKDPLIPIPDVDGTIQLVNAQSGAPVQVFKGHQKPVKQVVFSPDGTQLVSGSVDGTVRLWNVEEATHRTLLKSEHPICAVAISTKGDQAACAIYQEKQGCPLQFEVRRDP